MEANWGPKRKSLINPIPAIRRLASRKLDEPASTKSEAIHAKNKGSQCIPQSPYREGSFQPDDSEDHVSSRASDIRQHLQSKLRKFKVSFKLDEARSKVHPTKAIGANTICRTETSFDDLLAREDTTICQSDIPGMFLDQGENQSRLMEALVLSAEDCVVEAGSCESVMRKKFGETGIMLLRLVSSALNSQGHTSRCPSMTVRLSGSHIAVIHHGNREDPSPALLWLCLALRFPKVGSVSISQITAESSHGCRKFALKSLEGLTSSAADASCWHPLFESAVIAVEPTTNITPGYLLQVDFQTLVRLAAVEYAVKVDSGNVLLGYSTALIPVKILDDDTILWHLEVCPHESQFKLSRLRATKLEWLDSANIDFLKSKTARVGWCSKSKVLLGTASLLQSPVDWSMERAQKKSCSWKGVSLQAVATSAAPIQIGLSGGATFERVTNTLRFDLSRNYLQLLRTSSREAIIIYDVEAKRGWLVSLLSVLHHMAVTYCQSTLSDQDERLPIPLAKPSANGGISSMEALWQSGSVEIESGGDDALALRDLLMGFSANLAKISPQKPRHGKIFGYEFMDVVQEAPTANLKRTKIKNEGQGWIPLLQSVPCLFCSNLGNAIVAGIATNPNSDCCRLMPGYDYLAASIHSINDISKRQGRSRVDGDICFPGGSSWRPTAMFQGCDHADESINCWGSPTFLQEIRKKQPTNMAELSSPIIHKDGVVVFGEKVTRPSRLRDWMLRAASITATDAVHAVHAVDAVDVSPPKADSHSEPDDNSVDSPSPEPLPLIVSFVR